MKDLFIIMDGYTDLPDAYKEDLDYAFFKAIQDADNGLDLPNLKNFVKYKRKEQDHVNEVIANAFTIIDTRIVKHYGKIDKKIAKLEEQLQDDTLTNEARADFEYRLMAAQFAKEDCQDLIDSEDAIICLMGRQALEVFGQESLRQKGSPHKKNYVFRDGLVEPIHSYVIEKNALLSSMTTLDHSYYVGWSMMEYLVKQYDYLDNRSQKSYQLAKNFEHSFIDIIRHSLGYKRAKHESKVTWVKDVSTFDKIYKEAKEEGIVCIDFETVPRQANLPKEAPSGKKVLTQKQGALLAAHQMASMVSITTNVGHSYIIPMAYHQSWFNVGSEDQLKFVKLSDFYATAPEEDKLLMSKDTKSLNLNNGRTPNPQTNYVLYRKKTWQEDYKLETTYSGYMVYYTEKLKTAMELNHAEAKMNGWKSIIKDKIFPFLNSMTSDPDIEKVAYNAKFDFVLCMMNGCTFEGKLHDPQMMVHTLNEVSHHYSVGDQYKSLKDITWVYYPEFRGWEDKISYTNQDLFRLGQYAGIDTDMTMRLYYQLELQLMDEPKLYRVYRNLESRKIRTLGRMQKNGALIDVSTLHENIDRAKELAKSMQEELYTFKEVQEFITYKAEKSKAKLIKEAQDKFETALEKRIASEKKKMADEFARYRKMKKYVEGKEPETSKYAKAKKLLPLLQKRQFSDTFVKNNAKQIHLNHNKIRQIRDGNHKDIYREVNFNSHKQVNELLYARGSYYDPENKVDIPIGSDVGFQYETVKKLHRIRNTSTGKVTPRFVAKDTTDKKVLQDFEDPTGFIGKYLEYKMIDRLLKNVFLAIEVRLGLDQRIRTSYGTVKTQRLSSFEINLQNIPSRTSLKSEIAKEIVKIAKMLFIAPDPEKNWYFAADYSQCELRMIAHVANETHMIEAYQQGKDLHSIIAAKVKGIPYEEFYPERKGQYKYDRNLGKGVNFGAIYKTSAGGLKRFIKTGYGIDISEEKAAEILKDFFELYPELPVYHINMIDMARAKGYVETLFGSRRHTPAIHHPQNGIRQSDERVAVNSPIQGAGSQYLTLAMITMEDRVCARGWDGLCSIELTVHDSVSGWARKNILKDYLELMIDTFQFPPTMELFGFEVSEAAGTVDIELDVEAGTRWGDVIELDKNKLDTHIQPDGIYDWDRKAEKYIKIF